MRGRLRHDVDLERQALVGTWILAALLYVTIIGINFADPNVQKVQEKGFGQRPFGLPVVIVISIAQTILYIPVPFMLRHAMRIGAQAVRDGESVGRGSLLRYLLLIGRSHPELRRSQYISIAGLAYFIAIAAAWIAYTEWLGI